jgi:hypothetical protein
VMPVKWYWNLTFDFLNTRVVPVVDWCSKTDGLVQRNYGGLSIALLFPVQRTTGQELSSISGQEIPQGLCSHNRFFLPRNQSQGTVGQSQDSTTD